MPMVTTNIDCDDDDAGIDVMMMSVIYVLCIQLTMAV